MIYEVDCKQALIQTFFDLVREAEGSKNQLKDSVRDLMTLIIVNHPKLGDVTAYLSEVDQIETTFMDIVDAFLSLQ